MLNEKTLPAAIGEILRQNNYNVEFSRKYSGSEVDIVASPKGAAFGQKLYIEATISYVDNTKYGKDFTKFGVIRELDPEAICIIVSLTGFTPDVEERARASRVRTYTYNDFF
ncbi:restriction endonuclease [Minwuia thermotolerans]|uniref:restriction endonuclease n=1 Tax=Minwuia thermotolerans TaxID=2056226 RepID=UPI000F636B6E|nr:restriction endonuclease [Minwuia thermotolerans]